MKTGKPKEGHSIQEGLQCPSPVRQVVWAGNLLQEKANIYRKLRSQCQQGAGEGEVREAAKECVDGEQGAWGHLAELRTLVLKNRVGIGATMVSQQLEHLLCNFDLQHSIRLLKTIRSNS